MGVEQISYIEDISKIMANNVVKVNSIAIANIAKLNGQTDADLAKLNGEEFTGGPVWTTTTSISTSRDRRLTAGAGGEGDHVLMGGYDESNRVAYTDEWNGSSWATSNNMGGAYNEGVSSMGSSGTGSSDAAAIGIGLVRKNTTAHLGLEAVIWRQGDRESQVVVSVQTQLCLLGGTMLLENYQPLRSTMAQAGVAEGITPQILERRGVRVS